MTDDRYGYPKKFDILKCKSCGFMGTYPVLKESELSDLYTDYYSREKISAKEILLKNKKFNPNFWWRLNMWLQGRNNICHFYIKKNEKVLDVGCGDGSSLLEIKKIGGEAWGTEEDRNIIKVTKKLKIDVFVGGLDKYKEKKHFFDVITTSQVIEHVPNPKKFLSQLKEKLKKNGRIILSFPNPQSLSRRLFGKKWINWHIPYHQNFFSKESLGILTKELDLKVVSLKTITPNLWSLLQIMSLVVSKNSENQKMIWSYSKKKKTFSQQVIIILCKIISNIFLLMIIPFNRIIDVLGFGDSFLIVLENKK